jgi:hypothetical protein
MKRFHVKVFNGPANVRFEMDLMAEDAEKAKAAAIPYASQKIADFMSPYNAKTQWREHNAYVEQRVADMEASKYWDPKKIQVKVQEYQDPVIAFAWDLIEKPRKG